MLQQKFIKPLFLVACLVATVGLNAQTVKGYVYGPDSKGNKEALVGATLFWLGGNRGVSSSPDGAFSIAVEAGRAPRLVASLVGYTSDTLLISDFSKPVEFILKPQNELDAAVVIARQQANFISRMPPIKTEVISAAGLCKMACCNLAESFENSASVSVGYADAITGARQIRLLGLSGIYTQMSDENRPAMRGLLTPFGLGFIPGQWLESIQIAKGPSSVVNGYEAITGQINLEYRKPTLEQPLYVNLFLSSMLRTEANITSSLQMGRKWSTIMLGHFSTDPKPHDGNDDGFLDEPLSFQYNFANRWLYAADNGIQWRFGFKALYETREAGQDTKHTHLMEDAAIWQSKITNKGLNVYSKVGIPLKAPGTETSAVAPNVAFVADYTYHNLESYFGRRAYDAEQNSLFLNLMLQFGIKDAHRFNMGFSGHYDDIQEIMGPRYPTSQMGVPYLYPELGRKEHAWGVYGEYTFTAAEKLLLVAGARADYNDIYGWLFTPRANLKYDFTENLIFRASGGRGFRSPNLIADNLGVMSTGRQIYVEPDLKMEDAWTYGLSLTGYFPLGFSEKSSVSFDFFRTDFMNQILVDQERDLSRVWFYNAPGASYTNTYQIDLMIEPIERFSILTTLRYTDAKVELPNMGLVERPLMGRYKGVLNLQYATRMNKWTFDFTAQINGPSRLPWFAAEGAGSALGTSFEPAYSPVYPMFYAQITRKLKDVDVYIGGENLFNYKQAHPIIDAENPFSQDFNATVIWGPLMGLKVYAGLRFTLWK
jgi:Outer membrane cobalamin receptor protein